MDLLDGLNRFERQTEHWVCASTNVTLLSGDVRALVRRHCGGPQVTESLRAHYRCVGDQIMPIRR